MKEWLKKETVNKVVATIMAFVYILNLIPTWYASEELVKDGILRIVIFVVLVIFWLPAMFLSLWWIWLN